jgi:hypothetical protein
MKSREEIIAKRSDWLNEKSDYGYGIVMALSWVIQDWSQDDKRVVVEPYKKKWKNYPILKDGDVND